jgi:hypothetical protein
MRLYVIDDYRSRNIHHPKGAILEVTMGEALFLVADAPGCFSTEAPSVSIETAAVEAPPADKMLRNSNSVRKGKAK